MPEIRLDKSRPYSECKGERLPDDPDYRVCYRQGEKLGKSMVLLPFDAQGKLVPDDGKTEPWAGRNTDDKPVTHFPLWNQPMRDLLAKKLKRLEALAERAPDSEDDDLPEEDPLDIVTVSQDVNFVQWLQGDAKYEWAILQAAAKQRFHRVFPSKREMVVDLVEDERLIPPEQVCPALSGYLTQSMGN